MRRLIEFLVFIMLLTSSRAIFRLILDGGAVDQTAHLEESGSNTFLGYMFLGWKLIILLIFTFLLLTKRLGKLKFGTQWGFLIILCFLSMAWAKYPDPVRVSSFMILCSYLLVLLHFEICGWLRAMRFIKNVFLLISILSIAFALLLPSYGISVGEEHQGKWQGVFAHKNELGLFASLAYVFFLSWHRFEKSLSTKVGIIVSAMLILGCVSTTAYSCLAIVSLLFLFLQLSSTRKIIFSWRYMLLVLVLLGCIYAIYASINSSILISIGEKDSSFSNRNLIWAYLLTQSYNAIWLGHGLEQISASVMTDNSSFQESVGFVVGTAHNGFVDAIHALGLVGL
ncbi:MAG: hypothetical protein HOP21_05100, partial [Methylotenera sp.]|nr:hypothetical protein [Methylotenera sp.]